MKPTMMQDWRAKAVFSTDGPKPTIVAEDDKLKLIIGALEAGQKIPVHPEALAVYHFLEGTGRMVVDTEVYRVAPGVTVITPEGAQRGVDAETRLVFMATRIA